MVKFYLTCKRRHTSLRRDWSSVVCSSDLNEGSSVGVIADFTGAEDYDASSTATAISNAATGYACGNCQGRIVATSQQVNNSDVSATSSVNVTGYARSTTGVANAVGNTASYYVSRPSGQ